jgi:hypothetical protein
MARKGTVHGAFSNVKKNCIFTMKGHCKWDFSEFLPRGMALVADSRGCVCVCVCVCECVCVCVCVCGVHISKVSALA